MAEQLVVPRAQAQGPPWLGVMLRDDAREQASGVEVTAVLRRSPADGSGIEVGDLVVRVDGTPVTNPTEIRRAVARRKVGDAVEVIVKRAGKRRTFSFPLGSAPDNEAMTRNHLLGFEAPEFTFEFVGDGRMTHLAELRGKPTIVEFWATWCGPCRGVQDRLATVKDRFGERVNIVGISDESPRQVKAYLQYKPARYAMATNVTSRYLYAVNVIPQLVLLDAEHRVVAVLFGLKELDLLEAKIENLLSNE